MRIEREDLLRTRVLHLSGDIDMEEKAGEVFHNLAMLLEDDNERRLLYEHSSDLIKPIKLYINSYGGSVPAMLSFIGLMESTKTPIYTYCTGFAHSAAFGIFLAGDKRYITPYSDLMYHSIYCSCNGSPEDIKNESAHLDRIQEKINKFILDKTKIPKDFIEDINTKQIDYYFTPEELIKYKIGKFL